uniref:Uncharacterized protein n=1 Tax=Trypanosoma congolense (strain IL3000) TaxID=1068625 RepID=G0UIR2_TRYCI|nr:conserved hypothetical protein [Trypanosoma congolense IL3000]
MSIRIKQFEEGQSWIDRRSAPAAVSTAPATGGSSASAAVKGFSVCTMDAVAPLSAADMDALSDMLTSSSPPSFVFIHNCSASMRKNLMQMPCVKKFYCITENVRYEPRESVERGTVALIRNGINCDSADNLIKQVETRRNGGGEVEVAAANNNNNNGTSGVVRLFMILQVRSFLGASVTVAAMYIEPSAAPWLRTTALSYAIPQLGASDVIVICANLFTNSSALNAEMCATCTSNGFVDASEEAPERHIGSASQQDWGLWMKSSKFCVTNFAQDSPSGARVGLPFTTATFGSRSPAAITIPQPRSAKSGNARGSPRLGSTPAVITDPAILSAEAGGRVTTAASTTKGVSSTVIERLLQQQQQQQQQQQHTNRWRATSIHIFKGSERLTREEMAFDLSPHFSSVQEALDALNSKAINWPADFCVVQDTILATDAVAQCDKRATFRRYARDYKNSALLQAQMFSGNGNNSTNSAVSSVSEKATWGERVAGAAAASHTTADHEERGGGAPHAAALKRDGELRVRTWDIAWCTIVYQVTPREMKFNITPLVGVGRDNLVEAIQYLNMRAQSKGKPVHPRENPLHNYNYDYALLFSLELQGYWLIAATDVPCDIVACRSAV